MITREAQERWCDLPHAPLSNKPDAMDREAVLRDGNGRKIAVYAEFLWRPGGAVFYTGRVNLIGSPTWVDHRAFFPGWEMVFPCGCCAGCEDCLRATEREWCDLAEWQVREALSPQASSSPEAVL
jgi:hypothetical protein